MNLRERTSWSWQARMEDLGRHIQSHPEELIRRTEIVLVAALMNRLSDWEVLEAELHAERSYASRPV